jgi:hypothetical protein
MIILMMKNIKIVLLIISNIGPFLFTGNTFSFPKFDCKATEIPAVLDENFLLTPPSEARRGYTKS